jgi:hypothetical protein
VPSSMVPVKNGEFSHRADVTRSVADDRSH